MSSGAAETTLSVGEREILMRSGETVLEALERAGLDAASGCRSGVCAKCLVRSDDPPAGSQRGLRSTLRAQGYFYACQARPTSNLVLDSGLAPAQVSARVLSVHKVAEDVAQVFLSPGGPLSFRPGQYLDVIHPSGAHRSYSIASLPSDGHLELHVRLVKGGLLSPWLHGLAPGEQVSIRGAFGQCFYAGSHELEVGEPSPASLLLVGAGTGLAPLLGIARDALSQGHVGPIDLVHGGLDPSRLYLREELKELERSAEQLRVHHCVLREATSHEHEGPLDQIALKVAGSLADTRAYLCGDEGIVRLLQRALFLAGVPSGEILADPFSPAPTYASQQTH
ncbi:MAG: NAD(P)H-flavin reductase/ferredoxin [Planctomycetota bacterium]|jgi:CDP-4-dehydro-6-deoxyglucose reductase